MQNHRLAAMGTNATSSTRATTMTNQDHPTESEWAKHFTPDQREEQLRVDREAWNGIIGTLIAIAFMGVVLGVSTVLAITFLTS